MDFPGYNNEMVFERLSSSGERKRVILCKREKENHLISITTDVISTYI